MTLAPVQARPALFVNCSPREVEVLRELVKDGADNETVARRLGGLSVETIKTHFRGIYRKTRISTRPALIVAIWRRDVIILDRGVAVEF